jgi:hypothetical protein
MTDVHDRERRLMRKYGITEEQWQALWDATEGHCPACLKRFSSTRLACVDHDHVEGRVRGLLCTDCNYAIGERHDNARWFIRVGSYLHRNTADRIGLNVFVPGSIGAYRQEKADE